MAKIEQREVPPGVKQRRGPVRGWIHLVTLRKGLKKPGGRNSFSKWQWEPTNIFIFLFLG